MYVRALYIFKHIFVYIITIVTSTTHFGR